MMHLPYLSLLIWQGIIAAGLILWLGDQKIAWVKGVTYSSIGLSVLLTILLWIGFDPKLKMQFIESMSWMANPSVDGALGGMPAIRYHLGVDGISFPMVWLTVLTNVLLMLFSEHLIDEHPSQYRAIFLLMQSMTLGIFCALDGILFYVFWEGVLIPMYLCIGIWGSQQRAYAAIKFFIYTFIGSAMMLIALIYLGLAAKTYDILAWVTLPLSFQEQLWLFIAFLLAFAIKVPMVPVHTWLPDAHTEAPAGGSVILAALMLKVGAYGFFRFNLPILPDASQWMSPIMIALSLIAIVYIGLVALAQTDMKRLIAYSSVAHMGFVTLGLFAIYNIANASADLSVVQLSLEGALVQMIAHAFGSGAMFLAFWLIYNQLHTRKIANMGGIGQSMPYFTAFFVLFAFSNVALPGTTGFVGEIMVILSVFRANAAIATIAALTTILSACYTLWMVKRVFYGPITNDAVATLTDINGKEQCVLFALAVTILLLGFYPNLLLNWMHPSVSQLATLALKHKVII